MKEKSGAARLLVSCGLANPSPTNNTRSGSQAELDEVKATQSKACKDAVKFADESPAPPATLAKELEFPDAPSTDYNLKTAPAVCVCVCVLVCLCAGAGARVRNHGRSGRDKCGVSSCWLVHDRQCRMLWRVREQKDWRG